MGKENRQQSKLKRFSWEVSGWRKDPLKTPEKKRSPNDFDLPGSDIIGEYKPLRQQEKEAARLRARANSNITPWRRLLAYWAATQTARQSAEKATAHSAKIAGPVLAVAATAAALSIMLTASSPEAVMMVVSNVPVSVSLTAGLTVAVAAVLFAIVCLATYAVEHRRGCVKRSRDRALEMTPFTGSSTNRATRAVSVHGNDFGKQGRLTFAPRPLTFNNDNEAS